MAEEAFDSMTFGQSHVWSEGVSRRASSRGQVAPYLLRLLHFPRWSHSHAMHSKRVGGYCDRSALADQRLPTLLAGLNYFEPSGRPHGKSYSTCSERGPVSSRSRGNAASVFAAPQRSRQED